MSSYAPGYYPRGGDMYKQQPPVNQSPQNTQAMQAMQLFNAMRGMQQGRSPMGQPFGGMQQNPIQQFNTMQRPQPIPQPQMGGFNPRSLINVAQNRRALGLTGQPLGEEGFGPAGSMPKMGMSQGVAVGPSSIGNATQNFDARIAPNTFTKAPYGMGDGGAALDPQSPRYAQAMQQFNAMQGQQVGNTGQMVGPPAQGRLAPGTFAVAGDPRNFAKGGFAVKPVWDKKRPKDLGKPKDLSVKKKKSAKARAKAAGRPYPNLVDNMAAARKKGK